MSRKFGVKQQFNPKYKWYVIKSYFLFFLIEGYNAYHFCQSVYIDILNKHS